jgi:GH15 family glucan-1,4-alpha-glucosidase
MMRAGFSTEASEWGDWLLRAAAGHPGQLQMLYGAARERFLPENKLKHLRGYEDSRPVRVGNAAMDQKRATAVHG